MHENGGSIILCQQINFLNLQMGEETQGINEEITSNKIFEHHLVVKQM